MECTQQCDRTDQGAAASGALTLPVRRRHGQLERRLLQSGPQLSCLHAVLKQALAYCVLAHLRLKVPAHEQQAHFPQHRTLRKTTPRHCFQPPVSPLHYMRT